MNEAQIDNAIDIYYVILHLAICIAIYSISSSSTLTDANIVGVLS